MHAEDGIGERLSRALDEWIATVGDAHVIIDRVACDRAASATFATTQRIPAIVRPANRSEVQACLRTATRCKVPLYPISRGLNWGFGSRVPVGDGQVLLDLQRMNRIVAFDEQQAYIVVEPGVSFADVHHHLRRLGSKLYLPAGGGPAEGSVIGNTLERGEGHGAGGARAEQITGLEVVLASGEHVHTGFDRFVSSRVAHLWSAAPGPDSTGLFLQSNLGVVTSMSIALATRPDALVAMNGAIQDEVRLARAIDVMCQLTRRAALSTNTAFVWNDHKLRAVTNTRAPAVETAVPCKPGRGAAPWHISCQQAVASAAHATATRTMLRDAFRGILDPLQIASADAAQRLAGALGDPTENNARSIYHSMKGAVPDALDPERDGCGVRWVTAVLPFLGVPAVAALGAIEALCRAHALDVDLALVNASERRLHLFAALIYDRTHADQERRAANCEAAIYDFLSKAGFPPYRLGVQSMHELPASREGYDRFMANIKAACDPAGILAPGRYEKLIGPSTERRGRQDSGSDRTPSGRSVGSKRVS